ncbi:GPP34 family phosphoprotein [Streptomyces sp. NPDC048383]|uniref:GOLPH3/VPS74 family protein n=1 Tax=unclassified Streptomyces TaxID=2593676 RepID=UPI003419081C
MSLAGDMILLAFDAKRGELPVRQYLAPAVRGAMLAELLDRGALTDEAGTAKAVGDAPQDAALRQVWQGIVDEPGRKWLYWVRKDGRESIHYVLRSMEQDGLLEQSISRVFGVFALNRADLTPHGLSAAGEVRAEVRAAVAAADAARPATGTADPDGDAGPGGRAALLAGLAHAGGQLSSALSSDRRRVLTDRLMTLAENAAPVSEAVCRAAQDFRGAAAA